MARGEQPWIGAAASLNDTRNTKQFYCVQNAWDVGLNQEFRRISGTSKAY